MELLEKDEGARLALRNAYQDLFQRLNLLEQGGEITAMFRASRYVSVKKEVEEIMGGQILNYEAKDIRNSGIHEGISIGKEAGRQEGESLALKLIQLLIQQGRTDDVTRASIDPEARQQLYREFHLI